MKEFDEWSIHIHKPNTKVHTVLTIRLTVQPIFLFSVSSPFIQSLWEKGVAIVGICIFHNYVSEIKISVYVGGAGICT